MLGKGNTESGSYRLSRDRDNFTSRKLLMIYISKHKNCELELKSSQLMMFSNLFRVRILFKQENFARSLCRESFNIVSILRSSSKIFNFFKGMESLQCNQYSSLTAKPFNLKNSTMNYKVGRVQQKFNDANSPLSFNSYVEAFKPLDFLFLIRNPFQSSLSLRKSSAAREVIIGSDSKRA